MDDKGKIAMAVAGGYLLGRTKKGKLVLTVALWLAGSQLGLDPKKLAREGITKLGSSPQLTDLSDKLRGPLAEAGKRAALATFESRVNRLADALQERAHSLGAEDPSDADEQQEVDDEDAEQYADEDEDEDAPTSKHSEPTRRSTRTTKAAKKTSASKKATNGGGSRRSADHGQDNSRRRGGRQTSSTRQS